MKALITGASSGLGKELSLKLSELGYDLILVSRNKKALDELKEELKTKVIIYDYDLSNMDNIYKLYEKTKNENIDLLINNAGFGELKEFIKSDINNDLNMIDLNIKAVHLLTKLYLKDMVNNDSGRILNVSSSAAFQPGPLMSTYYATKGYVYSMTMAIYEELRRMNSKVQVHVLCPGAFKTAFFERANIDKGTYVLDVNYIAQYTLKEIFKNKLLIVPGLKMKFVVFFGRFIPRKLMLKLTYKVQKNKIN